MLLKKENNTKVFHGKYFVPNVKVLSELSSIKTRGVLYINLKGTYHLESIQCDYRDAPHRLSTPLKPIILLNFKHKGVPLSNNLTYDEKDTTIVFFSINL